MARGLRFGFWLLNWMGCIPAAYPSLFTAAPRPIHPTSQATVSRRARSARAFQWGQQDGVEAGHVTAHCMCGAAVETLAELSDCSPVPPGDGGWGVGQHATQAERLPADLCRVAFTPARGVRAGRAGGWCRPRAAGRACSRPFPRPPSRGSGAGRGRARVPGR